MSFRCFLIGVLLLTASSARAENWPQFRGPTGQGESAETHLPLNWSDTQNVAWKTTIPGIGWSSPVIWEDHIFLTSTSEDGISCHVICVERKSGKIAWDVEVFKQKPTRREGKNSYASPTPVTDGQHVYAVFMEGGIACLDFDGKVAWTSLDHPFYNQHGMGTSPILYKDLLIIAYDTSAKSGDPYLGWQKPWDQAYVLALDKKTGEQRWKTMRGMSRISHGTPRILEIDGKTQLISNAGDVLQGFEPDTGKLLWWAKNSGETPVPTPVFGDGMLFTESGFMDITVRGWRIAGTGDITKSALAWELKKAVPTIPSFAFCNHRLYTLKEDGILQAIEPPTGKILWKQRLDGAYSASPVIADGRIYFLAENGTTTIIDTGPEFKILATNPLGEQCQASMAVSNGQFFIRGRDHLFCISQNQ